MPLTRCRIGLLRSANSQFEGAKNIKFTCADMRSSLKAMLNTPALLFVFSRLLRLDFVDVFWWASKFATGIGV